MSNRIKTIELFLALSVATGIGTQATVVDAYESDENVNKQSLLIAQDAGGESAGGEGGESAGSEGGESAGGEGGESAGGEGGESAGSEGGESAGGEGGESAGSEGGEAAVDTGDAEVDYMTVLGLMKGHLMAAEELIALGKYEEAEPHIGHPVEELYSDIEPVLPEKGVEDFKPTLNQLHDLIKTAPDSSEVQTLFDETLADVDTAIAAVPEAQATSPEFVLSVITEMLKNAATEYEAAIANNQFVEAVEYQDSRGFVLYADELYKTVAEQHAQANPEGHQVVTESLAELKTAWPSIELPQAPVKEPSEIYGLVSQIEFNK